MSTNGTEYRDKTVYGSQPGGPSGSSVSYADDFASIPAGLTPGSTVLLGDGNQAIIDANGNPRLTLPASSEGSATPNGDVIPPSLESGIQAQPGQRVLLLDTTNGQVQGFLRETEESDGDTVFIRHIGGDVPAQVLPFPGSADSINGGSGEGVGQTFALSPNTSAVFAADKTNKTWWKVGGDKAATNTSS